MFVTTSFKKLRILSCALLVFTSLLTSATVFAIVFQCTPVALAWDKTLEGTCVDVTTVFYSHAGINISLDFIIYITPMPMLWSVQRPIRERMALIVVFAIGGFVCVTGILRLWSLQHAATSEDPSCMIIQSYFYFHSSFEMIWSLTLKRRGQRTVRHLVLHRSKRRHCLCLPSVSETTLLAYLLQHPAEQQCVQSKQ